MSISVRFLQVATFLVALSITALHEVDAMAVTSSTAAPTTHIVSYVHLAKAKKKNKAKYDEFPDFDFENIRANGNLHGTQSQEIPQRGTMLQQYERLVQQVDTNLNNNINGIPAAKQMEQKSRNNNNSDDLPEIKQNTLDNSKEVFGPTNNHHESPTRMQLHANGSMESMWNRNKQSIPVLEPVKHLVNSVRDGALNHTFHNRNHHHQLLSPHAAGGMDHMSAAQNESSAIETEQERDMVNESTEFKLLEVLGTLGGMIWSLFANLQKLFAASSGSASAAASSSSSGGNR